MSSCPLDPAREELCFVRRLIVVVCGDVYINFCLAHSGQMMSSASVMKPRPTREVLHEAQMKQSLCQWRSSKEMNRVPPIPTKRKIILEEYCLEFWLKPFPCFQPTLKINKRTECRTMI